MKNNLPCEIVMDLLPSYIDGLTSEMSTESVDEHLKECEKCRVNLEEIKKNFSKEDEEEESYLSDEDKNLIKKINRKVNRNARRTGFISIISIVLILLTTYILYNESIKKVSIDDIEITAEVFAIEELEIEYGTSQVTEKKDGKERTYEEKVAILYIPTSPLTPMSSGLQVSASMLEGVEYLTVISLKSPYFLSYYSLDTQKQGEENIQYVEDFRTTFLNNQPFSTDQTTYRVEFEKIDKIMYLNEDGVETVVWENEDE